MRIRKAISILLAFALLLSSSLFTSIAFGAQTSSIELQLDKNVAKAGETIKATLSINNISNFAGYQVNLKYDPAVLQPIKSTGIQYTNTTIPESGTLLGNSDFGILPQALHNVELGILNFGKLYTNLEDYRTAGTPESSGSIAVIYFKVLQEKATSVVFADSKTMPVANIGTNLFDWNGNKITSGYTVVQPGLINSDNQNPIIESNISMEFDKTSAAVGEIVKATINANNIENFAGYQVNLKYDPAVLQPVTASGNAFTSTTIPTGATILTNEDFGRLPLASNDITNGILNFSVSYTNLEDYRVSGNAEKTGTLAVIQFKVLQGKATTVSFEDTAKMPGAITGTMLFNWNGEKIKSGYTVKQAGILNKDGQQVINGNVSLELDKTTVSVGDIVTATVKIDAVDNFAGYQVSLSYDPATLKPVTASGLDYTNTTMPASGTLLGNSDYGPYPLADHNLSGGILCFGKSYTNLEEYKKSGTAEKSGTLAVISFQVLRAKSAAILFENTASMPSGISGTMLFDWNGDRILSGYTVTQPSVITVNGDVNDNGVITLDLDKTSASVGDIITATVKVNKMNNLAGYQVNLKYDPEVLQAVNPITGVAYGQTTNPLAGGLLNNSDYGVIAAASHDFRAGILNFARSYTNLEEYRLNGYEESGTLGVVGFKVLKEKATSITFENTGTMPSAIVGTMLFDWYGNRITSGYQVIQPEKINSNVQSTSYIKMNFDKTEAAVGEIIKASIVVNDIEKFAGYQVNLKYDPAVLQPVNASGNAYTSTTNPSAGDILVNQDYGVLPVASHNLTEGILNFTRTYTNIEDYRLSGIAEEKGTIADIYFKVLKPEQTSIQFENSSTMPNSISGTMLFNWNAERIISGYEVIQPEKINTCALTPIKTPVITVTPTKTIAVTPTAIIPPESTPAVTPTTIVTPTVTATPTSTTVVPTATNPQTIGDSYITVDLDKTTAKVNDTIKATVRINNIENFSGFQANLIYDPAVLQPITASGTAYSNSSIPSSGTILKNSDFGVIPAASHNVASGKLNFGKLYTNLEDYRASGNPEETGTVAVITFKVLAESATSIKFENAASMPNGVTGTMLFDWFGNRIASGYKVIQPEEINANVMPTSYIAIELDKANATVGETVKAIVRVNEIGNLSGYQINLKYDPTVLQPVKSTGAAYTSSTIPSSGTLIANVDYGPVNAVSHNLTSGILNFGKLYTALEDYRASGSPEETGTLAVIEFKVLKSAPYKVEFENSTTMPNGINGTMLFDWNGNRITSGYTVYAPKETN